MSGLVWLEGSESTTVETTPARLIFEIRPPSTGSPLLPVEPICSHWPTVEFEPPSPPSATYRSKCGPKVSPRGLLNPVAKTDVVAARGAADVSTRADAGAA